MVAADMAAWRRNNSDAVKVELLMKDGARRRGTYLKSRDKTVRELLNMPQEPFIDFECADIGSTIIAKDAVAEVRPIDAKRSADAATIDGFKNQSAAVEGFDSYQVLGIEPSADKDAVHSAYIKRARAYHPDRFAEVELPAEIRNYIDAMARRVNAAYADISDRLKAAKRSA